MKTPVFFLFNKNKLPVLLFITGITVGVLCMHTSVMVTVHTRTPAAEVGSSLVYSFDTPGVLEEAGSMEESSSPYWWLNSGGELILHDTTGSTLQGATSDGKWYSLYRESNPVDTDQGTHPQNRHPQ